MWTAVTFDFWNTLMWEAPHALVGSRLRAVAGILDEAGLSTPLDVLEAAHETAFHDYQVAWLSNRQYVAADAVASIVESLGLSNTTVVSALAEAFDVGSRAADVRPCPGMNDCVRRLAREGFALGIICDIGLTPSGVVREFLGDQGVLDVFTSFSFSDEVGWYKPDKRIFEHAMAGLGVTDPSKVVHIGDRTRTDVAGARAMGMTAVRYAGIFADGEAEPAAHHVVRDLAAFAELVIGR